MPSRREGQRVAREQALDVFRVDASAMPRRVLTGNGVSIALDRTPSLTSSAPRQLHHHAVGRDTGRGHFGGHFRRNSLTLRGVTRDIHQGHPAFSGPIPVVLHGSEHRAEQVSRPLPESAPLRPSVEPDLIPGCRAHLAAPGTPHGRTGAEGDDENRDDEPGSLRCHQPEKRPIYPSFG